MRIMKFKKIINKKIEGMEYFKKRKVIDFDYTKFFFELELYDENNKKIVHNLEMDGKFEMGKLNIKIIDENNLGEKIDEVDSTLINVFLKVLYNDSAIFHKDVLLVTDDSERIMQHELQHIFDDLIKLKTGIRDREYRACLASLVFGRDREETYENIYRFNRFLGGGMLHSENDGYDYAVNLIMKNIKKMGGRKKLKEKSLFLLNENYLKHTGLNYEEIVKIITE